MKPSRESVKQTIFSDDEERRACLYPIFEAETERGRRESLAALLTNLRDEMEGTADGHIVAVELENLIELLFRRSEAYGLALSLYASPFEIVEGDAERLLRETIAREASKRTHQWQRNMEQRRWQEEPARQEGGNR